MKDIHLGTIGTGIIVQNVLDQAVRTEGLRLEAVYSRSGDRGRALAERYGCARVFTDPEAFLSDEHIDCVYIALPNALHYEYARRALLHGKHVLLEKPFCVTGAQARDLFRIAEERDLLLAEAIPTAFLPNLYALARALPEIGRVRLVLANFSKYSSRYDELLADRLTNIFDPALAGGCLMDINYYNAYLTAFLFGAPREVRYAPNLWENGVDTSGVLTLYYDDFTAVCAAAKDTWGPVVYQIEGEKGYLRVEDGGNGLRSITLVTKDGSRLIDEQPEKDRYANEVRGWVRLLRDGEKPLTETTLISVDIMEKAVQSAGLRFI